MIIKDGVTRIGGFVDLGEEANEIFEYLAGSKSFVIIHV